MGKKKLERVGPTNRWMPLKLTFTLKQYYYRGINRYSDLLVANSKVAVMLNSECNRRLTSSPKGTDSTNQRQRVAYARDTVT